MKQMEQEKQKREGMLKGSGNVSSDAHLSFD
jgi:hypothetical protein